VLSETVEKVLHGNILLGLIIRAGHSQEGIEFFTPQNFSQQLAYMNRPAGYKIAPHLHNEVRREVFYTQEVLFIRKGKVRVDFYDERQQILESRILRTGDVILLAAGGHGFEMLEQTEMIEVKQGPYAGDKDKRVFDAADIYKAKKG
jgi:mannose-6-phosphate isomerase-like protein (cupin superfamily)